MGDRAAKDLRRRKKEQYLKLVEFMDLSEQLEQAVSRRDEASAKLLLAMREEPLEQMWEIEQGIRELLQSLPAEEAILLGNILSADRGEGTDEQVREAPESAVSLAEDRLREQADAVTRLLQRAAELDKRISVSVYGKRSFYHKFR